MGPWGRAARRQQAGSSLEEKWTRSKAETDHLCHCPSSQTLKTASWSRGCSFAEEVTVSHHSGSQAQNWAVLWLGGAPTSPGVPCSGLRTFGFLCHVAVSSTQSLCFSGSSYPACSRVKSPGVGQAGLILAVRPWALGFLVFRCRMIKSGSTGDARRLKRDNPQQALS